MQYGGYDILADMDTGYLMIVVLVRMPSEHEMSGGFAPDFKEFLRGKEGDMRNWLQN